MFEQAWFDGKRAVTGSSSVVAVTTVVVLGAANIPQVGDFAGYTR
jgi:hypothetical protein